MLLPLPPLFPPLPLPRVGPLNDESLHCCMFSVIIKIVPTGCGCISPDSAENRKRKYTSTWIKAHWQFSTSPRLIESRREVNDKLWRLLLFQSLAAAGDRCSVVNTTQSPIDLSLHSLGWKPLFPQICSWLTRSILLKEEWSTHGVTG